MQPSGSVAMQPMHGLGFDPLNGLQWVLGYMTAVKIMTGLLIIFLGFYVKEILTGKEIVAWLWEHQSN